MERLWTFDRLAVTMRRVDFLDPAMTGQPDARERGVRVEIKPAQTQARGSVYASDVVTLEQALCRCDFLESGSGKADRMHWHPEMAHGEPGGRTFEAGMPADPRGWLISFLRSGLPDYLSRSGHDITSYTDDLTEVVLAFVMVVQKSMIQTKCSASVPRRVPGESSDPAVGSS